MYMYERVCMYRVRASTERVYLVYTASLGQSVVETAATPKTR